MRNVGVAVVVCLVALGFGGCAGLPKHDAALESKAKEQWPNLYVWMPSKKLVALGLLPPELDEQAIRGYGSATEVREAADGTKVEFRAALTDNSGGKVAMSRIDGTLGRRYAIVLKYCRPERTLYLDRSFLLIDWYPESPLLKRRVPANTEGVK